MHWILKMKGCLEKSLWKWSSGCGVHNALRRIVKEVYFQALHPEIQGWEPKICTSKHQVTQMQGGHRLWETPVVGEERPHCKLIIVLLCYLKSPVTATRSRCLRSPVEGHLLKLERPEEWCNSWHLILALWINEWIFEFRIGLKWLKSWGTVTLSKFLTFSEPEQSDRRSEYPRCWFH